MERRGLREGNKGEGQSTGGKGKEGRGKCVVGGEGEGGVSVTII